MAQSKYELLKRLASEREEKAAERMRRTQARLEDAQKKLQQLETYRQEYEARFAERAQSGMAKAQWVDFRQFLGRLAEAVDTQRHEVEHARKRYQVEHESWQEERKKVVAFDKLIERERQQAVRAEVKREQKSTDEFAARSFWSTSRHK
jgi:flagellar FliJ protein